MQITITSIFISLLTSSFLILLLAFVLTNKRNYKKLRLDFISILFFITVFRLCFPSESFYTITIEAPVIMNPITEFFHLKIISNITIMHILIFIWSIGCICKCKTLYHRIKQTNYLYAQIKRNARQTTIKELLPAYQFKNYSVYISELISSPMVLLFKKAILMPNKEFTELEVANILHHEAMHLKQHDAWIKCFVQILVILYWWFPLIYLLEKQINLYLELRVDAEVSKAMTKEDGLMYLNTLLSVKQKCSEINNFPSSLASSFLIIEHKDILKFRIEYFLQGNFRYKTSNILLLFLLCLFVCSNLIILEPSYPDSPLLKGTFDISDFHYILQKNDGTYHVILKDGTDAGIITNVQDPLFNEIEIRKE